jgi:uncharacterized coiled-coil DUF342 family protein
MSFIYSDKIKRILTEVDMMQNEMSELQDKVELMESVIKEQSSKLDKYNEVFYYLLGGLFNSTTQRKTFSNYMETIFDDLSEGEKMHYENVTNNSKWGDLPTTRQGDENEQRIEQLEAKLNAILEILQGTEKEETETQKTEDNCYSVVSNSDSSSHSSMPDLIECSDTIVSDHLTTQNSLEYSDTTSISSRGICDDIDDTFD